MISENDEIVMHLQFWEQYDNRKEFLITMVFISFILGISLGWML